MRITKINTNYYLIVKNICIYLLTNIKKKLKFYFNIKLNSAIIHTWYLGNRSNHMAFMNKFTKNLKTYKTRNKNKYISNQIRRSINNE